MTRDAGANNNRSFQLAVIRVAVIAVLSAVSNIALAATPAFSVHKNGTNQTIAQNTDVKLTWSTEGFDTNNNFATDRFTPTVAGKYLIVVSAQCAQAGACMPSIRKNNALVAQSQNTNFTIGQTPQATAIVDMNGSTDYIEAFINSAGTVISGTANRTYFSGSQIDGAGSGGGTPAGSTGDIQFNTGGAFDADTGQLFWDKTNNRLGIGTTTPATALDVKGEVYGRRDDAWFNFTAYQYSDTKNATLRLMRSRGTEGAQTHLQSGDIIGAVTFRSTLNASQGSSVMSSATQTHATGAFGSNLQFQTTANNATNPTTRMTISESGIVGIGTATPAVSALVDISSTAKGFLPPRMTAPQRDAITAPDAGLMIFNTTKARPEYYDGTRWMTFAGNGAISDGTSADGAAASCNAIMSDGFSTGNGTYWIDPDGSGGSLPFQSFCDMTTNGGGWTLCGSYSHLKHGSTAAAGFDYLSSTWNTGNTVFMSGSTVQAYGNFCNVMSFTSLVAQVRSSTTTVQFTTPVIPATGMPFAAGQDNRFTTTNGYIGIKSRSAYGSDFYATATCTTGSNSFNQGTVLCVGNGTAFQAMLGNINAGSTLGDYACAYNSQCGTGAAQTVLLFAK